MSNTVLSIPKRPANSIDQDFAALRKQGLKHIEALAHQYWTEYNASDPGITILEALCYAITDLGLRIGMPIEDLLADDVAKENEEELLGLHQQFHSALHIMPMAPVTVLDYRKLLINIKGVKNAWLSKVEPQVFVDFAVDDEKEQPVSSYEKIDGSKKVRSYTMGGLTHIKVEFEDELQLEAAPDREQIMEQVKRVYHRNRNLCEDLVEVSVVEQQEVVVCGEIELAPTANAEKVNARMFQVIQGYLTPSVRFYTLEEMLKDPKLRVDEIFNGPLFLQDTLQHDAILHALLGHRDLLPVIDQYRESIERLIGSDLLDKPNANLDDIRQRLHDQLLFHGFIKNEELQQAGLRKEIRVSDLINLLLKIEGVKEVRDLVVGLCEPARTEEEDCNCDKLDKNQLKWMLCLPEGVQPILCFSGSNFRFYKDFLPINVDKSIVKSLWVAGEKGQQRERFGVSVEDLPIPEGHYRRPEKYYSFQNDLPDAYGVGPNGLPPVPENERPERLAKARQLKAYLSFFDQVLATYFSQLNKVKHLLSVDVDLTASYFTQAVSSIKDIQDVFPDFEQAPEQLRRLLSHYDDFSTRRHQQLDHLIARFAERFNDYAFMLYNRFEGGISEFLINQKQDFLRVYPRQSSRRFTAYNYYESAGDFWDTNNVSGLQRRIAALAGFTSRREDLHGATYEFYQEEDEDTLSEFRWRIKDNTGKILLSSSGKYTDESRARAELKETFMQAQNKVNMPLKLTDEGDKWYFNVLTQNALGEEEVIGRRIQFWTDKEAARAARDYVADFLKGKFIELEGMYVIEHLLLRPDLTRKDAPPEIFYPLSIGLYKDLDTPLDPYSFRITILLPGWTERLKDPDFRQFLERMIRLETPAHVMPRICWVGLEQMAEFAKVYKAYLEARAQHPQQQVADELLTSFLTQLHAMRTVYWSGTLHDCVDEGADEEDNPILLNRTFLGNLENQESDADKD